MFGHALLSLQLNVEGNAQEILIPIGEEDCGFTRARDAIERIGLHRIQAAKLGHVELDGSVTPWLDEAELLDWSDIPF